MCLSWWGKGFGRGFANSYTSKFYKRHRTPKFFCYIAERLSLGVNNPLFSLTSSALVVKTLMGGWYNFSRRCKGMIILVREWFAQKCLMEWTVVLSGEMASPRIPPQLEYCLPGGQKITGASGYLKQTLSLYFSLMLH